MIEKLTSRLLTAAVTVAISTAPASCTGGGGILNPLSGVYVVPYKSSVVEPSVSSNVTAMTAPPFVAGDLH